MLRAPVKVLGFGVTTPGKSSESWPLLRPFSGSALSVVPEMTSPTVADSVCRTGDTPVTSIASSSVPTSSLKSTRRICFASSSMGFVAAVLKPESSVLTTYNPTGSDVTV